MGTSTFMDSPHRLPSLGVQAWNELELLLDRQLNGAAALGTPLGKTPVPPSRSQVDVGRLVLGAQKKSSASVPKVAGPVGKEVAAAVTAVAAVPPAVVDAVVAVRAEERLRALETLRHSPYRDTDTSMRDGCDDETRCCVRKEKNRVAARKCRAKKIQNRFMLQKELQELTRKNEEYRLQVVACNQLFSRELELRENIQQVVCAIWQNHALPRWTGLSANDIISGLERGTLDVKALLAAGGGSEGKGGASSDDEPDPALLGALTSGLMTSAFAGSASSFDSASSKPELQPQGSVGFGQPGPSCITTGDNRSDSAEGC